MVPHVSLWHMSVLNTHKCPTRLSHLCQCNNSCQFYTTVNLAHVFVWHTCQCVTCRNKVFGSCPCRFVDIVTSPGLWICSTPAVYRFSLDLCSLVLPARPTVAAHEWLKKKQVISGLPSLACGTNCVTQLMLVVISARCVVCRVVTNFTGLVPYSQESSWIFVTASASS